MAWTAEKLIERLEIDAETASKILAVLDSDTLPETYKSVSDWVRRCYNPPALSEKRMYAFNEILGGHGIEGGCELNGDPCDFSYVNMGDPYACTILHDPGAGKFRLMSWGDFIEEQETKQDKEEG
jgi:hypothetical protein